MNYLKMPPFKIPHLKRVHLAVLAIGTFLFFPTISQAWTIGAETTQFHFQQNYNVDIGGKVLLVLPVKDEISRKKIKDDTVRVYVGNTFYEKGKTTFGIEAGYAESSSDYTDAIMAMAIALGSTSTSYQYQKADLMFVAKHPLTDKDYKFNLVSKVGLSHHQLNTSATPYGWLTTRSIQEKTSGIIPEIQAGVEYRPWKPFGLHFMIKKPLTSIEKNTQYSTTKIQNPTTAHIGISWHF